ncbi:SixA phosphatase family protein [Aminobacter sp. UC22_36]|uniref:SixA phosphatase family protein n=1 Tax=Aminobacter sp. UC22_36 TaxID=3374549 RepID=UPI00375648D6
MIPIPTRQLLLLRHAKSSREDPTLADFDRPLAPRGQKDAPRMGTEIATRDWLPHLALVSPSARTRETWQLASADWPKPLPQVAFPEILYGASADDLLVLARSVPDNIGTLLMVGHNPGFEDFARQLASPGSNAEAQRLVEDKFPPAALARFAFEGVWGDLGFVAARLTHCLRPKNLG